MRMAVEDKVNNDDYRVILHLQNLNSEHNQ